MIDNFKDDWFTAFRDLSDLEVEIPPEVLRSAFFSMTEAEIDPSKSLIVIEAIRTRGETPQQIAIAAECYREKMIRLDLRGRKAIDTCGTGGDRSGTFNISTAAALVVAGAGLPVVKHGNRSASSKCGSADVLETLGIPIEAGTAWSQHCFDEFGFAFCHAAHFHPAFKHVAPLRKKINGPTIFNLLGPLLNPGQVPFQLIGVGADRFHEPVAKAVAELGTSKTWVVRGEDGLDEISPSGITRYYEIVGNSIGAPALLDASLFELGDVPIESLKCENAQESAALIERILAGEDLPACTAVLLNAAACLHIAGKAATLGEGLDLARESIISGRAKAILAKLRASQ